jgi:hypothetical protein
VIKREGFELNHTEVKVLRFLSHLFLLNHFCHQKVKSTLIWWLRVDFTIIGSNNFKTVLC